ncbi:2476_t:CDS:1, partial [Ambispora gerdemannii]
MDTSSKRRKSAVPKMNQFRPCIDIPLRDNGSTNILEVLKSAVSVFDQNTIALGSSRS